MVADDKYVISISVPRIGLRQSPGFVPFLSPNYFCRVYLYRYLCSNHQEDIDYKRPREIYLGRATYEQDKIMLKETF